MNYTNHADLPVPLYNKLAWQPRWKPGRLSVTRLVRPVRMSELERRHDAEITKDAAENVWMLLGQNVHYILDGDNVPDDWFAEEKLEAECDGLVVSGRSDLRSPDGTLSDYKVTSCWSFLLGDKADWEAQLNVYAWLYRQNGIDIGRLQIVAILRDWSKGRAAREPDYPRVPFAVVPVPLWPASEQDAYVALSVAAYRTAEALSDEELPPCSARDRWEEPERFRVIKRGGKRGRNFPTKADAEAHKAAQKKPADYEIEHVPGLSVRCARFCSAAPFCSQYKAMSEEATLPDED